LNPAPAAVRGVYGIIDESNKDGRVMATGLVTLAVNVEDNAVEIFKMEMPLDDALKCFDSAVGDPSAYSDADEYDGLISVTLTVPGAREPMVDQLFFLPYVGNDSLVRHFGFDKEKLGKALSPENVANMMFTAEPLRPFVQRDLRAKSE
jgi:hypothetical protein